MTGRRPIDDEVDRVAVLLHREIGLQLESSLQTRVGRCVRDGAVAQRLSVTDYVDEVMLRGRAFQELLDDITVQESGFFRHEEHFEVLGRDVMPDLQHPVSIWSAGCANGQEAYSLAMLLDEHGIAGSVIASDISEAALHRTNLGRYSAREIRGLSAARIARHLRPVGDMWEVREALRDRVSTIRHNLVDPLPRQVAACQVMFCRNILIYLSQQHIRTFVDRLAVAYPAGTPLFIGAAEVVSQAGDGFETVRSGNTFFYRRRGDQPRRARAGRRPSRGALHTTRASTRREQCRAASVDGRGTRHRPGHPHGVGGGDGADPSRAGGDRAGRPPRCGGGVPGLCISDPPRRHGSSASRARARGQR